MGSGIRGPVAGLEEMSDGTGDTSRTTRSPHPSPATGIGLSAFEWCFRPPGGCQGDVSEPGTWGPAYGNGVPPTGYTAVCDIQCGSIAGLDFTGQVGCWPCQSWPTGSSSASSFWSSLNDPSRSTWLYKREVGLVGVDGSPLYYWGPAGIWPCRPSAHAVGSWAYSDGLVDPGSWLWGSLANFALSEGVQVTLGLLPPAATTFLSSSGSGPVQWWPNQCCYELITPRGSLAAH